MLRQTHTFVELEISKEAFTEIYDKLVVANYQHTFIPDIDGSVTIDMSGIGVKIDASGQ